MSVLNALVRMHPSSFDSWVPTGKQARVKWKGGRITLDFTRPVSKSSYRSTFLENLIFEKEVIECASSLLYL